MVSAMMAYPYQRRQTGPQAAAIASAFINGLLNVVAG
jgi:hypothetical protein